MAPPGGRSDGSAAAWTAAAALALLAAACGGGSGGSAGAPDAAVDGLADASRDAGSDATIGPDGAGPPADGGAGDDATVTDGGDDGGDGGMPASDAPVDGGPDVTIVTFLDASCVVEIDQPPLLAAEHVPIGTDIQWNSNPPSSGPHFPIWAAYQAYTSPVPRGYYVHDLEHGGIVLLYNCDGGCANVVAGLQAASDALPDDPLCLDAGEGVRVRTVITPDPLIDVPVAAAAWGWVYKAQCLDLPTLQAFALAHYGQGPEVLCGNGTTQF